MIRKQVRYARLLIITLDTLHCTVAEYVLPLRCRGGNMTRAVSVGLGLI